MSFFLSPHTLDRVSILMHGVSYDKQKRVTRKSYLYHGDPYIDKIFLLRRFSVNKPKHLPLAPAKLSRAAYIMHRVTPNGHDYHNSLYNLW